MIKFVHHLSSSPAGKMSTLTYVVQVSNVFSFTM